MGRVRGPAETRAHAPHGAQERPPRSPKKGVHGYAIRRPAPAPTNSVSRTRSGSRSDYLWLEPGAQRATVWLERHDGLGVGKHAHPPAPLRRHSGRRARGVGQRAPRGSAAITAPSGWNLIRRDSSSPGYPALTQALYYKVAGAAEPPSYGWTLTLASSATGAILDFKNVDRAAPIDSHSGAFTSSTRFPTAPSVTTTVPGDVVVGFFTMAYSRSLRPPTGMTEVTTRATEARPGRSAAKMRRTSSPQPARRGPRQPQRGATRPARSVSWWRCER